MAFSVILSSLKQDGDGQNIFTSKCYLKPWHYWKRWTMVAIYIYMGLPRDTELSDGDSDLSDDEAIRSSIRLGRGLLEAEAEITGQENETPCRENRTGRCPLNKTLRFIHLKSISINIKTYLYLCSLVFSIASYGSECWVLKKSDKKKIDAFDLWCYRRLLRISCTERKTNERNDIDKELLMGTVYENPKIRFSDNIKEIGGGRSESLYEMDQDRVAWRATAVQFEPTKGVDQLLAIFTLVSASVVY
ncbi:hypothetical protein GQR58_026268 [Nymphon striatum]|nr:hypothetical protein GQR58_026268 [Nymphon striatum]